MVGAKDLTQAGGKASLSRQSFSPAPTVHRFELDSETILFNAVSRQVFILNETAAFVWDALGRGLEFQELADQISLHSGAPRDLVLADCQSLCEQWTDAGLGRHQPASAPIIDREPNGPLGSNQEPPEAPDSPIWRHTNDADHERRCYRIADLRLTIEAPSEAFDRIAGLLDHCLRSDAAHPDTNSDARPSSADEEATLTVIRVDNDWGLFLDGILVTRCDGDSNLAPMIHATALHLSYAASQSRLLIHGAAVFSGDRCVLLPGQPRAGKSTLTAALVASGFGYCTDDFSLLDGSPLRLRGIPLCIGLKEGSWPLFETMIPAVEALSTHIREDGQRVRYFSPPAESLPQSQDRFRVAAVVFPSLADNGVCRLDPLPRSTALLKVANSGYHLMGELDAETIEATVAWLGTLDCYELNYWDLDAAVAAISRLLS